MALYHLTSSARSMIIFKSFNSTSPSLPDMNSCYVSNVSLVNITEEQETEHHLQIIITKVNLYVPPILIIVGNIFNILAILVMRHKYFRNMSTSVYMVAGAVNDAVSMLISLIAHWVSVNFPDAIQRNVAMDWMCAFFNFYGWGNCDFSIIVTAAMTADRAYAIKYPLKNSSANSIKRAKIVIAVLSLVVVAKQFHFWFYSYIVPADRKDRMCDVDLSKDENYCRFYQHFWPFIHIAFLSVCFMTIICSNFIIINSVRKASGKGFRNSLKIKNKNNNQNCEAQARRNTRARSKWRQITVMLLADSFALVLLTFPFSIHLAITMLTMQNADAYQQKINGYVFALVLYLLYSNKCVNFCLYCMTGSRFRAALREVITCSRFRCRGASLFTVVSKSGFQGSTFSCNNLSTPNTSTPASSLRKEKQEEESDKF